MCIRDRNFYSKILSLWLWGEKAVFRNSLLWIILHGTRVLSTYRSDWLEGRWGWGHACLYWICSLYYLLRFPQWWGGVSSFSFRCFLFTPFNPLRSGRPCVNQCPFWMFFSSEDRGRFFFHFHLKTILETDAGLHRIVQSSKGWCAISVEVFWWHYRALQSVVLLILFFIFSLFTSRLIFFLAEVASSDIFPCWVHLSCAHGWFRGGLIWLKSGRSIILCTI